MNPVLNSKTISLLGKLIKNALPRKSKYPLSLKLPALAFFLLTQASLRSTVKLFNLNPSTLLYWVKKLALFIADLPTLKLARTVGIDETKLRWRRKGETLYVWLALDLERKEVLEVMVTTKRGTKEAISGILRRGLSLREIVTDRGPWYRWLERWEYGRYRYEKFGSNRLVERAFRYLKERLRSSLQIRSQNLKYIEGLVKLIYLPKLAKLSCLI